MFYPLETWLLDQRNIRQISFHFQVEMSRPIEFTLKYHNKISLDSISEHISVSLDSSQLNLAKCSLCRMFEHFWQR
jgi:hypothetical protein